MHIVLIETSSNQRFIFSTNKLRENVGASELTYQIGAEFARGLAEKTTGITRIITTSGKALLLADDENIAKDFVKKLTLHALNKMPGLTVHGAICEIENNSDKKEAENLHEAVNNVHRRLEEIRYQIPSNLQRFQRLPFVAECSTSNLPAEELYKHPSLPEDEDEKPHSHVSITKQNTLINGKKRVENTIRTAEKKLFDIETPSLFQFANNPKRLDLEKRFDNTKWFAIIHADGNGLGQIFLDFQNRTKATDKNDYCKKYAFFSDGLDQCTENAAAFALKNLQTKYLTNQKDKIDDTEFEVPAIPLILGGDDLTIICDGQYAIKFTRDFLTKFVEETKKPEIQDLFPNTINLGICAGIAIIKPHFPFHQAYRLAAELLQSAKKTKQISPSLSAFDYHVLYDSSGTTLEAIRKKTEFVARPYVVTDKEEALKLVVQDSEDEKWIINHHFDELAKRVEAMTEKDADGKNNLPNSQLHILREGLYLGKDETEARANLIKHRYEDKGFDGLLCNGKLFFRDIFKGEPKDSTHFLDALDIVEFWK